jgi:hypothetical protein
MRIIRSLELLFAATNKGVVVSSLIHQKLAIIASKVGAVAKHSENKDDKYKFRSIYDIYNQLQPIFKAEGVFIVPRILESAESIVATNKGRAFRVKVKVEWMFSCTDGTFISAVGQGEGIDSSDKATNKAMTASLKYLLIYMFLIPTIPYDTDADFTSPTIEPFEPRAEPPKTLLAMAEHKGLTRADLLVIGGKIGIASDKELDAESRKKLFEFISGKTNEELKLFLT